MGRRCYCVVFCLVLSVGCGLLMAQAQGSQPSPGIASSRQRGTPPRSDAAEADPNDSSSRQTKVDMSPPPGEAPLDLKSEAASDRQEVKPWDPHKADHNVEVGDQYFQKNNYEAAISRYREALRLNPDAPGPHYHLALALVSQDNPKEALPHAQKARDLALAAGQSALAAKAEELLKQHR